LKAAALRLVASVQGLSGDSIAIILAIGIVLGTFPMYGVPTVFCVLAARVLRLNAPALQLVNQLVSPLRLAMLIPFARLGERILGAPGTASHGILSRFSEFTIHHRVALHLPSDRITAVHRPALHPAATPAGRLQ